MEKTAYEILCDTINILEEEFDRLKDMIHGGFYQESLSLIVKVRKRTLLSSVSLKLSDKEVNDKYKEYRDYRIRYSHLHKALLTYFRHENNKGEVYARKQLFRRLELIFSIN